MTPIRPEIHSRCRFAADKFVEYTNLLNENIKHGSIVGLRTQLYLGKINQCNRIWQHYTSEYGKIIKSWRECEIMLEKRCFRIKKENTHFQIPLL